MYWNIIQDDTRNYQKLQEFDYVINHAMPFNVKNKSLWKAKCRSQS